MIDALNKVIRFQLDPQPLNLAAAAEKFTAANPKKSGYFTRVYACGCQGRWECLNGDPWFPWWVSGYTNAQHMMTKLVLLAQRCSIVGERSSMSRSGKWISQKWALIRSGITAHSAPMLW